ncbi:MAG: poly(A) polymerase [Oleispira sp.]|jgi:poly(A) polymerase
MSIVNTVARFFPSLIGGRKAKNADNEIKPQILQRKEHGISRRQLSENALKVLYRLNNAGYQAYLVGGCVRDSMLGAHPKDFDVATSATPEQVNQLFRNSRLIGRRFKLVHVLFGREVIEVATFRTSPKEEHNSNQASTGDSGMILRDNVYGNIDDDAMRRDFTINAMYYAVDDFTVLSYAGGYQDAQDKLIRLMGDPETRYREDPVRMLRAIRFAGKLNFEIEHKTKAPIEMMAPLMEQIPAPRLFEEVLKLFLSGNALVTYRLLREYKLFGELFPLTEQCVADDEYAARFVEQTMINTDTRIQSGKSVTPYYFFAALLWPSLQRVQAEFLEQGIPPQPSLHKAASRVIEQQLKRTSIPKRFTIPMKEIWDMQSRLERKRGKKAAEAAESNRFRAAYDFVLLREQCGENLKGLGNWWTEYQETDEYKEVAANRKPEERHTKKRRPRRTDRGTPNGRQRSRNPES